MLADSGRHCQLLFHTCAHQFRGPELSVAMFLGFYSWVDEKWWDSGRYSYIFAVMSDHLFHRLMGSSAFFRVICPFLAQCSRRVLYICNLSFSFLFVFLKIFYGLFKN